MSDRSRIAYVDGPRLRRALLAACRSGRRCKAELNRINVFPVADGDTGTNLSLTLEAVAGELAGSRERRVDRVAALVARSALLGARGNCGMMLSQFLPGFSGGLEGRARVSLGEFASALAAGARSLDAAVENPVEDAGAQGFVEMVEGVVGLIEGGDEGAEVESVAGDEIQGDVHPEWSPIGAAEHPFTHGTRRYCTEILVEGPDLPGKEVVRTALAEGSEELLVIRSEEILKIHLHTDHPRDAIDYCATLGTVVAHKAEDMLAQFEAARDARGKAVRRPVGIMVDSGSDLPDAVARAHGIHMIPLLLIDGDRTLKDRIDVTAEEFHARLESGGPLPTTSQPPPGDFIAAYEQASTESEVVVAILVAASLSGIFRSAENANRLVPHLDVRLVDSEAASILIGLLALKAAELAEAGMPADEIIAEVRRIRRQSGILFTVRDLDRLIASGRVSQFAGWLGGVLDLKPILGLARDGSVEAHGKARGAARAKKQIMDTVAAAIAPDVKKVRFGVVHVAAPEMADLSRSELAARYGGAEILAAPIAPVIATHLGPGAWGIAYMVED